MSDAQRLAGLQDHLKREISAAQQAVKLPLSLEDVASIVKQVIQSLEGNVSSGDLKFYTELEDLARYIRQAKQDIAAIKPKDISTEHIPTATDELDAVVGATEEATNKIMDICDEVSAIAETCAPDVKEKLIACTTRVFEACNFQDITGQRITKVVETLKHIDAKVDALVRIMGEDVARGEGVVSHVNPHLHAADPEKGLLNGPQLAKNAASQEDIDKLLAGN